jgi:hypothetical protein
MEVSLSIKDSLDHMKKLIRKNEQLYNHMKNYANLRSLIDSQYKTEVKENAELLDRKDSIQEKN